jgi:hypothetical protein
MKYYRLYENGTYLDITGNNLPDDPYYLVNEDQITNFDKKEMETAIDKVKTCAIDILLNGASANYIEVLSNTNVLSFNKFLTIASARKKLLDSKFDTNVRLSNLFQGLKESGIEVYLSGSTTLWSILKKTNFRPCDLDFYVRNINEEKIFAFENVIRQTYANSTKKIVVSNNALSINFIIQLDDNKVKNIQLLKLNFDSMSEIFASFHLGHLCIAYEIHTCEYIYMPQRINDSYFFCLNSLISDKKQVSTIKKYIERGIISGHNHSCSILKKPRFVNYIFDIDYKTYEQTFIMFLDNQYYSDESIRDERKRNTSVPFILKKFYQRICDLPYIDFLDPKYFVCEILSDYVDMACTNIIKNYYLHITTISHTDYTIKCSNCMQSLSNSIEIEEKIKEREKNCVGHNHDECLFVLENHHFYKEYQYSGYNSYYYICNTKPEINPRWNHFFNYVIENPKLLKNARKS